MKYAIFSYDHTYKCFKTLEETLIFLSLHGENYGRLFEVKEVAFNCEAKVKK